MQWQDFGQTVSLTSRIRSLLQEYPEGISIFKELAQNADDACASTVSFCLDMRSHGKASLAFPELAIFQGPALLVHNDAVFSETDFSSITHIGDSRKKGQVGKTGKYGLGFNAVYHLTELPAFVSDKYLCIFDPTTKLLPSTSSASPGTRIDFVAAKLATASPDTAAGFKAFGCDMEVPFKGTLFRFALRTEAMAAAGSISTVVHTCASMRQLLNDLQGEAHQLLLFTKSIETIRILEWVPGQQQPALVFSASLLTPTAALRRERAMFMRAANAVASLASPRGLGASSESALLAALQQKNHQQQQLVQSHFSLSLETWEGETRNPETAKKFEYLVAQGCASQGSKAWNLTAEVSQQVGSTLVPWAAVALPISTAKPEKGRVFCTFPLPAASGVPAHINGSFELSSNRRDLWHGADLIGIGQQRAKLNATLLGDIAAPLYAALLGIAASQMGPTDAFFDLWPSSLGALRARDPISALVDPLLRAMASVPVAYTEAQGGRWLPPQQAIWLDDRAVKDADLRAALLQLALPIATMPQTVARLLVQESITHPTLLSPELVRQHAKAQRSANLDLPPRLAAALLDFAASDLIEDDEESVQQLVGLPLLPLLDGRTVASLGSATTAPLFLPRSPQEAAIFRAAAACIVDIAALRPESLQKLKVVAAAAFLNLRQIHPVHVSERLLPAAFPRLQGFNHVQWDPAASGRQEPPVEWVEQLWEWLASVGGGRAILQLAGWPIIPTHSRTLVAPAPLHTSNLVGPPSEKDAWPSGLAAALATLGVEVADGAFTRPCFSSTDKNFPFAHGAQGPGVLSALRNAFAAFRAGDSARWFSAAGMEAAERAQLREFLLRRRWFPLPEDLTSFLRSLPIFPRASARLPGSLKEAAFVDLLDSRFLPPPDLDPAVASFEAVWSSCVVLDSMSREAEGVLLDFLGVAQLSKASFYSKCVLPILSRLSAPGAAVQLLRELPILQQVDSSIVPLLKATRFVTTASGEKLLPLEVFDPRKGELLLLLDVARAFPTSEFAPVLDMLRLLGMQASAGRETLLNAAREVEAAVATQPDVAAARAHALLAYLDAEASRLAAHPEFSKKGEGNAGPSLGLDRVFSRVVSLLGGEAGGAAKAGMEDPAQHEEDGGAAQQFWQVLATIAWCPVQQHPPFQGMPWPSSVPPVARPTALRPAADAWLASSQKLLAGEVRSPILKRAMGWTVPLPPQVLVRQLAALGQAFTHVLSVALRQQLAEVVPQLYRALARLSEDELTSARQDLGESPCVWIGEGFAPVGRVALKGPLNLASAGVYVIPLELAPFRELLLALGVSASFSATQYLGVLAEMHAGGEELQRPLEPSQLEQALAIAAALADATRPAGLPMYLPDARSIMRDVVVLVYNDAPWTQQGPPSEDTFFVHPIISNDVADRLGVASLSRCLLAQGADVFSMALTGSAVEAFGQSEALTTRLRHILENYADGPGPLMEILQNADDSGATTARFLLDRSQWGTSKVMGSGMAAWQGPALMAWNSATFSASDVQNIARIGQNSKMDRPGATGRFGLGWNSVYHWTDLPSFVSGDLLVMFDPHAAFLPGVSPAQPGIKLRFPSSPLVEHFPDTFQPFQGVFGCDMRSRYDGTLFRFPLRSPQTAATSQIKQQAYSPDDVLGLFDSFKEQAPHVLLFLKNVRRVELWIRDDGAEPQQAFSVDLRSAAGVADPQAEVTQFVTEGGSKDAFRRRLKATPDAQLPATCSAVEVVSQAVKHRWLVSNVLAGGEAKQMALQSTRGWIPWAGVAAPVDGAFAIGRAFCFLPLPTLTHLGVHINGAFELSSNRRELWNGRDLTCEAERRARWNFALLENGVASAFVRVLLAATKEMELQRYYQLWPATLTLPSPWDHLSLALYARLLNEPVLWSAAAGGTWVAPSQAVLLIGGSEGTPLEASIEAMLLVDGVALVDGRQSSSACIVVSNLLEAHAELKERVLSPVFLRRYLGARGFALSSKNETSTADAAACLEYCLSDAPWAAAATEAGAGGLEDLLGVPLLPLEDGSLGSLSAAVQGTLPFLLPISAYGSTSMFKLAGRLLATQQAPTLGHQLAALAAATQLNLRPLDATCVAEEVLPVYLPHPWKGKAVVLLNENGAEQQNAVSTEWVMQLWEVLGADSSPDMGSLSQWPFIPASFRGAAALAAPSPKAGLVEDGGWSEATQSALSTLGCAFVAPEISKLLPDAIKTACVHPATGGGVLAALRYTEANGELEDDERDALRSFLLQSRWFDGSTSAVLMSQLHAFCIYRCCTRGLDEFAAASAAFNNLDGERYLAPLGFQPHAALPPTFIVPTSRGEGQVLVDVLGVPAVGAETALVQHVLPQAGALSSGALSATMTPLLHLVAGGRAPPAVVAALKSNPCVPVESGTVLQPSECFDPRSADLRSLLGECASFPAPAWAADARVLDGLVALGMQVSVTPDALLAAAREIHADVSKDLEADQSRESLQRRAHALVAALGDLASCAAEDVEVEWAQFGDLAFFPVHATPPFEGLPWPESVPRAAFAPARLVRPGAAAWLVSSTLNVLEAECSDALAEKMGWTGPLPPKVLCAQLLGLGRLHPSPLQDGDLAEKVAAAATQIYALLEQQFPLDGAEAGIVPPLLTAGPTVLVEDEEGRLFFAPPSLAAVDCPADLAPHVFSVSEHLARCGALLEAMKIPAMPTPAQLLAGLARMAAESSKPLGEAALATAMALVHGLEASILQLADVEKRQQKMFLPDAEGALALASTLYVNDAPWLGHGDLNMLHPDVGEDVALALGAKSLRYHNQVANQTSARLPCPPAALMRQLLEAQADPALLALCDALELADIVGCCSIDFHLDGTLHPEQSVLQPGLSALQGPALCVKLRGVTLTADELCRLQSPPTPFHLRQGTCRFGCGLLLGYLFSDVVQVISGDGLFIFDPSTRHLAMETSSTDQRNADAAFHGTGHAKQYRLAGTDLLRRFADQFSVWNWAEEDVSGRMSSTLLRWPLRTPKQASGGHALAQQAWSTEQALDVLKSFAATISQSLLFCNSVASIRVSHQAAVGPAVLLKQATFKLPLRAPGQPPPPPQHAHRCWCDEQEWRRTVKCSGGSGGFMKMLSWLGGPKERGRGAQSAPWQQQQKQRESDAVFRVVEHTIMLRYGDGGEKEAHEERWMVSVCAAGGGSGAIAVDKRHGHHGFTPQAGVAVQLQFDENRSTATGLVRSLGLLTPLPLPGEAAVDSLHGLPFTVCGFFALARAGGRHIVAPATEAPADDPGSSAETTEHVKARFNAALLKCVGLAAVELLRKLVMQPGRLPGECQALYSLLPIAAASPAAVRAEVALVCSQICTAAASKRIWRLRSGEAVSLAHGCFLHSTSGLTSFSPAARNFIQTGLPLFDAPDEVKPWLEAWGVQGLRGISPSSLAHELKEQAATGALVYGGAFTPAVCGELLSFALSSVTTASDPTAPLDLDVFRASCEGLPCLDFGGKIQRLGTRHTMFVVEAESLAGGHPASRLFANHAHVLVDFVHPELTGVLGPLVAHPTVGPALGIAPYNLERLAGHLATVLPVHWAPRGDAPMAVPWKDGSEGGPGPAWLLELWGFLFDWNAAHPGPHPSAWVDPLAGWTLVPTLSGEIVRLAFRHSVVTPPLAPTSLLDADAPALHAEPWATRLVPALLEAKAYILDPRFAVCSEVCNGAYAGTYGAAADESALLVSKLRTTGELERLRWSGMSPESRGVFVEWLAEEAAANQQRFRAADVEALQRAPIYPTWDGGAAAACGANAESANSVDGEAIADLLGAAEALPIHLQRRLLRHNVALCPLFSLLGVQKLDTPGLLVAVMRGEGGGVVGLTPTAAEACLDFIDKSWGEVLQLNQECTGVLASSSFVTIADGTLAAPRSLYDPALPLFATVFVGQPVFPHGKFASPPWLRILRALGLRQSLDRPTLLEAARRVERQARACGSPAKAGIALANSRSSMSAAAQQVWAAAAALVGHLGATEGSALLLGIDGRKLAEELREIPCVPSSIFTAGSAVAHPVLAQYSEIVLPADAPLAWSSAPVLDAAAAPPPPQASHSSLRIRSPPPFASVVEHLGRIGANGGQAALAAWPFPEASPLSACQRVLQYLEEEGLTARQVEQLKGVPLVAVANGTRLVAADRSLFVRLPVDAAPLTFELPPELVSGLVVLKQLGLRDEPSAGDLLAVLQSVPMGAQLATPQVAAVAQLLRYLLEVGASDPEVAAAAKNCRIAVPDTQGIVRWPVACVWGDAGAWSGLVPRLAVAGVAVVHPAVPPAVSQALRIPAAAQVIQERLDPEAPPLEPVGEIQGVTAAQVAARMKEECVVEAVHAALEAHRRLSMASVTLLPSSSPAFENVAAALRGAADSLEFVHSCRTALEMVTPEGALPLVGTGTAVSSFSRDGRLVIAAEPGVELSAALAAGVSKMFKAQTILPLAPLFAASVERLRNTAALVARGSDSSIKAETSSAAEAAASGLALAATAGQLGAPLTPGDFTAVKFMPLRRYAARELVAVRMPSGGLRYARVLAHSSRPAGAAVFRVTLEISHGVFHDILSSEILSFPSSFEAVSLQSAGPSSSLAFTAEGLQEQQQGREERMAGGRAAPRDASPAEIAAAVRSMLEVAGVAVDMQVSEQLEQILVLRRQVTIAENSLAAATAAKSRAVEVATQVRGAWQCRICQTNEVNTAFGCGHMLCSDCAARLPRPACPFCRKASRATKLYK